MFEDASQFIAQLYSIGIIIESFTIKNKTMIIKISLPEQSYMYDKFSPEQIAASFKDILDKMFTISGFKISLFKRIRKENFTLENAAQAEQLTLMDLYDSNFISVLNQFRRKL